MANQAIGIDIGTHAVKIAVLQRKGAVTRALRLYRATLAGDEDPVRVRGALSRAGISGGPALIGVTGRDLIVRYTHVPPVPDWRLKLLMQFEINEVSGQSGGEVAADYRRLDLPVEGDEDTVLVSLARNTYLHPRLDASRAAGMNVGGGCPNSVALFNAFLAHGDWKDGETTYLVNIGRENIDMAIQRDGELLFARNMSGGGQMFTEAIMGTFGLKEPKAEKNKLNKGDLTPKGQARYPDSTAEKLANAMQGPAGQLVSMIQSSVMICRAQTKISDLTVDRLVLTGGATRMKGVQEYFKANMQVPVELFDPVDALDLSTLNGEDANELGDDPRDFSVAIGLAETLLQPTAFKLEVLTDKEKTKRRFVERTVWSIGAALAVVVLVILLFQSRAADIDAYSQANEKLDARKGDAKRNEADLIRAREQEKDARLKEAAIRSRRLAGLFSMSVLKLLLENDVENVHLDRFRLECDKISIAMDGSPIVGTISSQDLEDGNQILQQTVWPRVEVVGTVQAQYTKVGPTYNKYSTGLIGAASRVEVDGFKLVLEAEVPDRNHHFLLRFSLKAPEPSKEEEN
jgi:type IV pilus assembly protein PilM